MDPPPPSLRVAALELPYRFDDPEGVIASVDAALEGARDLDLVTLCEAAVTGYVSPSGDFDLSRFAEPLEGPCVTALRAIARARRIALGIPWIERDGARCFNSYLVVDDAGEPLAHYRKRRPWMPERWAAPGDLGTPVFALRGLRFTIAVCYDIHALSRTAGDALDASDALLFPSAWVDDDAYDARGPLLRRVAQRHGLWVVNANWGDGAPVRYGAGRSRVLDPSGRLVAQSDVGARAALVRATLRARGATPVR